MTSSAQQPRAVLDTSVLISAYRHALWNLARLGLYEGVWSTFIVAELVRVRYRMTLQQSVRAGITIQGFLKDPAYDARIDRLIHALSGLLGLANYRSVLIGSVMSDAADGPVLATALAAQAGYIVSPTRRTSLQVASSWAFVTCHRSISSTCFTVSIPNTTCRSTQ
jgi:hypothetical protein